MFSYYPKFAFCNPTEALGINFPVVANTWVKFPSMKLKSTVPESLAPENVTGPYRHRLAPKGSGSLPLNSLFESGRKVPSSSIANLYSAKASSPAPLLLKSCLYLILLVSRAYQITESPARVSVSDGNPLVVP